MITQKKIILALVLLGIFSVFFLTYPIIKNRYFNKLASSNEATKEQAKSIDSEQADTKQKKNTSVNGESNVQGESLKISVTPADCDNGCSKFKKDEELEYCEQVCGISDLYDYSDDENSDSSDCSKKQGLQEDYCLKDLAISESDFKTCEQINDENIKKTCKNRLTENLLEKQQNSGL